MRGLNLPLCPAQRPPSGEDRGGGLISWGIKVTSLLYWYTPLLSPFVGLISLTLCLAVGMVGCPYGTCYLQISTWYCYQCWSISIGSCRLDEWWNNYGPNSQPSSTILKFPSCFKCYSCVSDWEKNTHVYQCMDPYAHQMHAGHLAPYCTICTSMAICPYKNMILTSISASPINVTFWLILRGILPFAWNANITFWLRATSCNHPRCVIEHNYRWCNLNFPMGVVFHNLLNWKNHTEVNPVIKSGLLYLVQ